MAHKKVKKQFSYYRVFAALDIIFASLYPLLIVTVMFTRTGEDNVEGLALLMSFLMYFLVMPLLVINVAVFATLSLKNDSQGRNRIIGAVLALLLLYVVTFFLPFFIYR